MAEQNYALIKDSKIVNILVFDSPSESLLAYFKEVENVDSIVLCDNFVTRDYTWENGVFVAPPPSEVIEQIGK